MDKETALYQTKIDLITRLLKNSEKKAEINNQKTELIKKQLEINEDEEQIYLDCQKMGINVLLDRKNKSEHPEVESEMEYFAKELAVVAEEKKQLVEELKFGKIVQLQIQQNYDAHKLTSNVLKQQNPSLLHE